MSRAGVQNAQGIAAGVEIHVQRLHHRVGRVRKVDGHHAAHGGGGLIHQAAGLSEEHILRVLADLRQLHGGTMPLPEQLIEHRSHQHLKGGGGAESAALGDGGGHIHVQPPALQVAAHLLHPGRHAPDQRRRGVFLPLLRSQLPKGYLRHGIALRQRADNAAVGDGCRRQNVQIHGGGQHTAPLVIGVVAAQLRAARRAQQRLCRIAKGLTEALRGLHTAGARPILALPAVKADEGFFK